MNGKVAMVKADMLPVFVQYLHNSNVTVQQMSLNVCMLLCVVGEAKRQATEIPKFIESLLYILVSETQEHPLEVIFSHNKELK